MGVKLVRGPKVKNKTKKGTKTQDFKMRGLKVKNRENRGTKSVINPRFYVRKTFVSIL